MSADNALRASREATVHEHIRAEVAHDLDGLCATFGTEPHYDIVPGPGVRAGAEAVKELVGGLLAAFPDLELHIVRLHHAEEAVIVEGLMTGTHRGPWVGLEPTGRPMNLRAAVFFRFDGDHLTNETVYYDAATLTAQLSGDVPPSG